MSTAEQKSLAVPEVNHQCQTRIEALAADTVPLWGEMTAAQMFAHCAEIFEVAAGKELRGTPWFVKLMKSFVRKMVVGPKPYPKSTRTHPQYLQVDEKEFGAEKVRLLGAMDAFVEMCAGQAVLQHSLFGEMTVDEAGWAMYKHLDHHLTQFGV